MAEAVQAVQATQTNSTERTYTEDEKCVLNHFFTNSTGHAYAATSAMPTQLWAYLVGGASRSPLSLRDRFLVVFEDVCGADAYADELHVLAVAIKESGIGNTDTVAMLRILSKATKFMSKWAVQYGHNSLKDSAYDRVAVDRVSIRGAKILEESHLIAYQEKSTRYQDFSNLGYVLPSLFTKDIQAERDCNFGEWMGVKFTEVDYAREADELHKKSLAVYEEILEAAQAYFLKQLNPGDFKSPTAMHNTARAKAFDTARYALLTCTPTALGFTAPTRETERKLSEWLAHPNTEIADQAAEIHKAVAIVNDGLLTHVQANKFYHQHVSVELASKALQGIQHTGLSWRSAIPEAADTGTVDLSYPGDYAETFLQQLAAAVLKKSEGSNLPLDVIIEHLFEVTDPSGTLSAQIIANRLRERRRFDELPDEFAIGEFRAEIELDYGAFRDLQRHRNGTLICSDLDCSYGFAVPELLTHPEFAALHTTYCNYMDEVATFHAKVRAFNPIAAEYWFALGHKVQFSYFCNFKQLIYICELRSQPAGHYSYRKIAQELYTLLRKNIFSVAADAILSRYFFVDMSDPFAGSSRAGAENRAAEQRLLKKDS